MTIETIPNTARVGQIVYTPPFSATCSVGHAPFWGTLEIVYCPGDLLIEFESFEHWLRIEVAPAVLTIEDLCRLVYDTLHEALGDIRLSVTCIAQTTVHAPVRATITSQGEDHV